MEHFDAIVFLHISREDNQLRDALATLSSMFKVDQDDRLPMIRIRSYKQPVYCNFIEEEWDGKSWYFDIKRYLQALKYPRKDS